MLPARTLSGAREGPGNTQARWVSLPSGSPQVKTAMGVPTTDGGGGPGAARRQ
ncbi:MAG: hypothetical protein QOJ60_3081 [Actinomycetota bacterium]|nr:hypothetical protein [Actinomycetota bacterium]